MANERKTENLVRDLLRAKGHYVDQTVIVEEQRSDNARITKLLKSASKAGGGAGMPEFILTCSRFPDLIIVIECKAKVTHHRSAALDQYKNFACDGALLYASYLSKSYDVIAIGVSGESTEEMRVDHFLHLKNHHSHVDFAPKQILSFDDYYENYISSPEKFNEDYSSLLTYSQQLNKKLHNMKVKESQRSLLISAILIALKNAAFKAGFDKHKTAPQLAASLVNTVIDEITYAGVAPKRVESLKNAYSFIKTHSVLSANTKDFVALIEDVDKEINGFMQTHRYFDTIGQFYIEFLRYANNDKGLGIVLTPPHITELFVDLAGVDKQSVVWDNCCGTGGFLISAMKKMVADAAGDSETIKRIKREQLFGLEYQDDIYALAISNMILHGDGKSTIQSGSCFNKTINDFEIVVEEPGSDPMKIAVPRQPNVGLLNPPYKADTGDDEEFKFILNNLKSLAKNGTCVAIIPISCVLAAEGEQLALKQELLDKHTLEAVLSMPEDLFHNSKVGVITCAVVITAHVPHPTNKKTWLGYWRNDGFIKAKGKGRIDANHTWNDIKNEWLTAFQNREVDNLTSVSIKLEAASEWCAEAYLTTDYSKLDESKFESALRQYLAFNIAEGAA